jgi:hypothetical protein
VNYLGLVCHLDVLKYAGGRLALKVNHEPVLDGSIREGMEGGKFAMSMWIHTKIGRYTTSSIPSFYVKVLLSVV